MSVLESGREKAAFLSGAKNIDVLSPDKANESNYIAETYGRTVAAVIPGAVLHIPLSALIDADKERERLEREKQKLLKEIERVEAKLSNEGFASKAPAEIIAAEREKLAKYSEMLEKIEQSIKAL
jgi:valyl-tRNA synthetase